MFKAVSSSLSLTGTLSLGLLFSLSSNATIVEFQTSHGSFKVNLHDQTTPKTVENFLKYVTDKDYDNTVIHRLLPDFIIQGGGYSFNGDFPLNTIDTDGTVINEPIYSSVKGTIAMAKPGNDSNGATSQWFVNYKDNSANLDIQNGGFTVFGEVIEGMDNLNAMANLPICSEIPMPDYTNEQCMDANFVPGTENFVTIISADIVDHSPTTDSSLSSIKNTLINQKQSSNSSGGTFYYGILTFLGLLGLRRKVKISKNKF